MHKIVLKEIDLRGAIGYVRDHRTVIELVQAGRIDLAPFVSHRIDLDLLVETGFDTLIHRNDTAVKIIVRPQPDDHVPPSKSTAGKAKGGAVYPPE